YIQEGEWYTSSKTIEAYAHVSAGDVDRLQRPLDRLMDKFGSLLHAWHACRKTTEAQNVSIRAAHSIRALLRRWIGVWLHHG
ncbi:MAG: hypothetical protein V3W33_04600, partial [Gammaproteobacteria bacterium]